MNELNCNDCQKGKGVGWSVLWMKVQEMDGMEAKVCTDATAHLATDQTIRFQCLMLLAKVVLVVGSPRIRAIPWTNRWLNRHDPWMIEACHAHAHSLMLCTMLAQVHEVSYTRKVKRRAEWTAWTSNKGLTDQQIRSPGRCEALRRNAVHHVWRELWELTCWQRNSVCLGFSYVSLTRLESQWVRVLLRCQKRVSIWLGDVWDSFCSWSIHCSATGSSESM